MSGVDTPPICDYEGSDYQIRFWERGGRAYEDLCEAYAIRALLPRQGDLLLELGAGAGRNTPRYQGFRRVVLLDYSRTQLQQARQKLGADGRYTYVAANIYHLPFIDGVFDAATMIRTLHHMADAPAALRQVRNVLRPGAVFLLEFANKCNLKAILRYALRRQTWNPFTPEPIEFMPLNFDFHPKTVRSWLEEMGFDVERIRTVSHFRVDLFKRLIPARFLAATDALFQWTGELFQLTPSVFILARLPGQADGCSPQPLSRYFKCPRCHSHLLDQRPEAFVCLQCHAVWPIEDGIYNFKL
ncbi:MAG: methyltransferase domain-containing protein [Anaerolineales bacterium]|nr:methyltransferase domain-containing protein [Anaerolineales bacterium]MDW8227703.1 methyltransferase domain-containing protein [Anaerolineales bacterium]